MSFDVEAHAHLVVGLQVELLDSCLHRTLADDIRWVCLIRETNSMPSHIPVTSTGLPVDWLTPLAAGITTEIFPSNSMSYYDYIVRFYSVCLNTIAAQSPHARLLTSPHTSTSTNGATMPYTKYSFLVKFSLMMSFPMISKNSFIAVLFCFNYYCSSWFCHEAKLFVVVAGTRTRNRRKTQLTLHRQHDTPYIYIASPKPSELFCPSRASFLSSFALLFRSFR